MSLVKLTLLVTLLLGGTAATVISYVDSRRPLPQDPVVVDQCSPVLPGGEVDLSQQDPEVEELEFEPT